MPMRPLRLLLDFLVYDGQPPTANPVDETRSFRKVEELNVTQTLRAQVQVPASTVNQVVPLATATNDYLAIFCDQPITINLNSDSTAITLAPQTPGRMCPVFFIRGATSIVSLTASNAGTLAANLDVRSVKI
jgi:hypothetical protein